jgi:formate hydrogenlyase subunit 6/NADH:ubiquinone oxidoreductase subunit I/ferredoxin
MLNDIIKLIPIYVMGKKYEVPQGLTILKAMEFAGYRLKRGCGCRGGVCGACVTIYRKKGNYQLKVGLACQTVIEPDIYLIQLPFVPANKAIYTIKNVSPNDSNIVKLYPELMRCLQCNTCTKACPMELDVMNYVAAAMRGDLKEVVELSIECVMCGMCAARCPAELTPFNIALLIRRMYGKHVIPSSPQLIQRLKEIKEGKFEEELNRLKKSDQAELQERYKELQATKGASV